MIRQDFQELPPKPFLMQILDTQSKVYVFLWERRNDLNRCNFEWKEVFKHFNKNTFRTNLRRLVNTGLISYEETDQGVYVELVGWDEIENE